MTSVDGGGAFEDILSAFEGGVTVCRMDSVRRSSGGSWYAAVRTQLKIHRAFKSAYSSLRSYCEPDFAYVMNLNCIDKVLPMVGSPFGATAFGGWLNGTKFHLRGCGVKIPFRWTHPVAGALFHRMLECETLTAVLAPDELLPRYLATRWTRQAAKVNSIIDVAAGDSPEPRDRARAALGIGTGSVRGSRLRSYRGA